MRVDVVDELLEKHYEDPDEAIMALVDGFGGRNSDQGLVNLILGLADFAQSQADPALWLQQICKGFEPEERTLEEMPWYEDVLSGVELLLQQAEKHLVTALQYSQTADGPASYEPLLLQEQETFGQLAIACKKFSWDELRSRIQGVLFHKLPASKGGDISLRAKTQHSRNAAKDIVNKLSKGYLAQTQTEVLQGLRASVPVVTKLVGLVLEYRQAFSAAKLHKGLVDFSDFEHMALRILYEEPSVCEELQARYAEVLVDEYQDVNGVQEAILQRVSRPNNRFMVGDVKQSIYRFRLAEPNLFIDKQKAYLSDANLGELIHLSHNFRSRPSVLNAVNFIFRQLMTSAYVGEVDYDTAAELRAGVAYPEGACTATAEVEMCLLDRTAGDHAAGEEDVDTEADAAIDSDEDLDHTAREAHFIAQTAKGLIEGGQFRVWDKATNSYRAVQYRDIVVLLRATRGRAETFVDVFRSFGLPVYADTSSGYFQTTEISVMLSVLHIIDNPRQDIPLAGVLRSPLFSFGAEDLAEIRLRGNSKDFWDCLRETAELDGSIAEKVQAFLGLYDNWRERARRGSLPLLIQRIYKDTGYYLYVGALPGGQQRQANLQSLYERSCQYGATSFRGLFRFLRFIERLQEQNGDLGAARSLGENEDVIRIMSIHKSKGLEFPVVFI
ncbi:MAG: UvrD-helicase domain-containing protein, partial [Bacillota bacterium]|nr:UvrD-helicase domain-containing protein [Bacillota bacterium]